MQLSEKIINGRAVASEIRSKLKAKIAELSGRRPGLAFILIGNDILDTGREEAILNALLNLSLLLQYGGEGSVNI